MSEPVFDTHQGGCHCGRVRFSVDVEHYRVVECNCSMCRMKGLLHLIVPAERFELLSGADDLVTYTFNTGVAKHRFCKMCGVQSFYRPRSHPEGYSVNPRCLDGDLLDRFAIERFDGQRWEQNIGGLRNR